LQKASLMILLLAGTARLFGTHARPVCTGAFQMASRGINGEDCWLSRRAGLPFPAGAQQCPAKAVGVYAPPQLPADSAGRS
jgi:hypothetical protein